MNIEANEKLLETEGCKKLFERLYGRDGEENRENRSRNYPEPLSTD